MLKSPPRWRDVKNHDNSKKISESKPQFSKLNVPTGPSTAEKQQPPCRAPQKAVTMGGAVDEGKVQRHRAGLGQRMRGCRELCGG